MRCERQRACMATITAPGHRQKQPYAVCGGARENRTMTRSGQMTETSMVRRRHPHQPYTLSGYGEGDTRLPPGVMQGRGSGEKESTK